MNIIPSQYGLWLAAYIYAQVSIALKKGSSKHTAITRLHAAVLVMNHVSTLRLYELNLIISFVFRKLFATQNPF